MEKDREKSIGLRYGNVEAALAEVMTIPPADMKAFRARLKHLCNIGTPSGLPEPGKGMAITYNWVHAFAMLIALQMEKIGHTPKRASNIANEIARNKELNITENEELFAVIYHTRDNEGEAMAFRLCHGYAELSDALKNLEEDPTLTVLNLSKISKLIGDALDRRIYT